MPLTLQRRQQLALMMLPADNDVQKRLKDFLLRSGLNQSEFAEQIGFAPTSIGLFLNDRYGAHSSAEGVTANLKAACIRYMDLHDSNQDIRLLGEHFDTKDFRELRESAFEALSSGTMYAVDGPPGTQKSWSLLQIRQEMKEKRLGKAVYVYSRVEHTKQSFLMEVCIAAGIPNRGSIDALLRKLSFFLGHEPVLFLIDECQHLSISVLEVLRQLVELTPTFSLIAAGSHEFTQRLQHWQMEQWRQRIQKTHFLNGPSKQEARAILSAQLAVTNREEADAIIADCVATATRHDGTRRRKYEYVSARLLFDFIRAAKVQEPLALEATA